MQMRHERLLVMAVIIKKTTGDVRLDDTVAEQRAGLAKGCGRRQSHLASYLENFGG
jgi:hypothetical protein